MRLAFVLLICFGITVMTNAKNTPTVQEDKQELFDTIWDVLNVLYDAGKIATGYVTSNPAMVATGWSDLGFDLAATVIPGFPAGGSKLAAYGVKESVKQGTKIGISTTASNIWLKHVLMRHGVKGAAKNKFLISSQKEVADLLLLAKERIGKGYSSVQWRSIDGSYQYIVDMGKTIGTLEKKGKLKPTSFVQLIITPNSKTNPGSFFPTRANFNEKGGFTNFW